MGKGKNSGSVSISNSIIQDTLLSCLGSLAAFLLLRWVTAPSFGFTKHLLIYLAGALVLSVVGWFVSGLNREIRAYASEWNGRRIIYTVLIKEVGLVVLLVTGLAGEMEFPFVLLLILADLFFSIGLMVYPRLLMSRIRQEDRQLRSISEMQNALVFGDDEKALELAERAALTGRYCVLGLLTRNPEFGGKAIGNYVIYYAASNDDLDRIQQRLGGIDCILFPKGNNHFDLFGNGSGNGGSGEPASGSSAPVQETSAPVRENMTLFGRIIKRSFDLLLSGLLLIVFSPLIAICALAVRIEDGKPVMYKQERVGRHGKPFNILKFRTMRTDAEAFGPALYSGDEDPRLTKVGKFLRQHHLDELPQFWNVFRGDMSFIGYRPERQFYIDKIMAENPRYQYLYQIRPGVTSYATLYNGYTDSIEKMLTRLDLDLYYLRNNSIWFDCRILGMTFLSIVGGKKF